MKLIPALFLLACLLNACANASTTPTILLPTAVPAPSTAVPRVATANSPLSPPVASATESPFATLVPTVFPTPFEGVFKLHARTTLAGSCALEPPLDLASKGFERVAYVPTGDCENGEIGLFKIGDKTYIAQSGLFDAAYTVTDVTNPTVPAVVGVWDLGTPVAVLDLKPFKQGDKYYVGLALQGNRQGPALPCGIVVIDVTNVRQPNIVKQLNGRAVGAPDLWCNVHTFEVDTDEKGDATFLIVSDVDTFSARAVDIRDLQNAHEVNVYHLHDHPHRVPNQPVLHYVHDSYISPDKIYLAYWLSGVVILDKQRFEAGLPQDPIIIKPGDTAPGGFHVHLSTPIADATFLFVQDELNADNGLRLLDIRDPKNPKTVWTETNPGGVNAPHNFLIRDNLIFVGWYNDGIKVFQFDVSNPDKPTVKPLAFQEVRSNKNITRERYFDGIWGVRLDDCTLKNEKRLCIYGSDMSSGLIVLALTP